MSWCLATNDANDNDGSGGSSNGGDNDDDDNGDDNGDDNDDNDNNCDDNYSARLEESGRKCSRFRASKVTTTPIDRR